MVVVDTLRACGILAVDPVCVVRGGRHPPCACRFELKAAWEIVSEGVVDPALDLGNKAAGMVGTAVLEATERVEHELATTAHAIHDTVS